MYGTVMAVMRQVAPRQKFHPSTRRISHGAQKLVAGQYYNWMEKQWYLTARTPGRFHRNDGRCDLSTQTILKAYQDEQGYLSTFKQVNIRTKCDRRTVSDRL